MRMFNLTSDDWYSLIDPTDFDRVSDEFLLLLETLDHQVVTGSSSIDSPTVGFEVCVTFSGPNWCPKKCHRFWLCHKGLTLRTSMNKVPKDKR